MATKVMMNLSDDELALIKELRSSLRMPADTGTVGQSLRIAGLVVAGKKKGKQVAFLDADGWPESTIVFKASAGRECWRLMSDSVDIPNRPHAG